MNKFNEIFNKSIEDSTEVLEEKQVQIDTDVLDGIMTAEYAVVQLKAALKNYMTGKYAKDPARVKAMIKHLNAMQQLLKSPEFIPRAKEDKKILRDPIKLYVKR